MHLAALYAEDRPRYSWAVVLVGLWVFAWLLRMGVSELLFSLWVEWNPGTAVGHWLLKTPLCDIAAEVRHFIVVYYPDCVALFCAGVVLGSLFFEHWKQITIVFGFAFFVISHAAGIALFGYVYEYALTGNFQRAATFTVFSVIVILHLLLGAWLGARWRRKKQPLPGCCMGCGYNLRGLPQNVCPECGQTFDQITQENAPYDQSDFGHAKRGWTTTGTGRMFLYRLAAASFLLLIFYWRDWLMVRHLLQASLAWCFTFLGYSAELTSFDGTPGLIVRATEYVVTPHCTLLDLAVILIPFTWEAGCPIGQNMKRAIVVAAAVLVFNWPRIGLAIFLNMKGIDWGYAHDVPYCFVHCAALVVVIRAAYCQDANGQTANRGRRLPYCRVETSAPR